MAKAKEGQSQALPRCTTKRPIFQVTPRCCDRHLSYPAPPTRPPPLHYAAHISCGAEHPSKLQRDEFYWVWNTPRAVQQSWRLPGRMYVCMSGGTIGLLSSPQNCFSRFFNFSASTAPPPPPMVFRRGGERCHPRGPASSEVTRAQQAHWELRSLECSWGREVLSTPQDLPSTGTLPAGLALCATLPVTLWVSQGAPQTTRPVSLAFATTWGGCGG